MKFLTVIRDFFLLIFSKVSFVGKYFIKSSAKMKEGDLLSSKSKDPPDQELHTTTINKNMKLSIDPKSKEKKGEKPLAVILAWMLARESHLDKYRLMYLKRGFDVLTVCTAPKELLFPVSGSQVIALNFLEYLLKNGYKKIVLHAFSVGGYLMGEIIVKIRDGGERYKNIPSRMQGVILDSAIDFEGIPEGFPRAVSQIPVVIKLMEWYTSTHLYLMRNIATKHYLRSSENFHDTPLKCPALIICSDADKVGNPEQNRLVMENWMRRGVDVTFKNFKDSAHVSHMYKYLEEYVHEVDVFLSKINLVPIKSLL